jgi:hypothetical protein
MNSFSWKFQTLLFAILGISSLFLGLGGVKLQNEIAQTQVNQVANFNHLNSEVNALIPTATLTPAPTATPAAALKFKSVKK